MIGKRLRIKDDSRFFYRDFKSSLRIRGEDRLWVLHSYLGTIRITVSLIGFQHL